MKSALFAFILLSLTSGCFGRIKDSGSGRKIDPKMYGLEESKPALLVFGAAWCKPCMSEIPSLNRADAELRDQLQVVGFFVEGAQKGVASSPKDGDLFVSPTGEKPNYRLTQDAQWRLFDGLEPGSGRSLPTLVFVNREHVIVRIVQRSMEYETELLPQLRALIAGVAPDPTPKPVEPDPGDAGQVLTESVGDWTARPDHGAGSPIDLNLRASWQHGLDDFFFLADDMPYDSATITFKLFADARTEPTIAHWVAAKTGCSLTVYTDAAGAYLRSEGVCR